MSKGDFIPPRVLPEWAKGDNIEDSDVFLWEVFFQTLECHWMYIATSTHKGKHHKHTLGNCEKYHHFLGAKKARSPLEAASAFAGVWADAYESTWVFCSYFLEWSLLLASAQVI